MAHARLGPSNHRWPNCPGSIREEAAYPDLPGAAAIDGTGTHILLETCLENNVRPEVYVGQLLGVGHEDNPLGWMIHQDRADRVQMCLDYISRRHQELSAQHPDAVINILAESHSDPGGMIGRDDWWGTVDVTIEVIDQGFCAHIEVLDYKDGRGWVDVKDNTQLISYLAGKMRPYIASGPDMVRPLKPENVASVRMSIVQPKTSTPVRYKDATPHEVLSRYDELALAAHATDKPDAPLIPDNKNGKGYCRWCKHKPNCSAVNQAGLEAVKLMTTEISAHGDQSIVELITNVNYDATQLDSEKLADLADAKPAIDAIFKNINDEIERRIDAGETVPGYAKQPGNSAKVWNGTEEEIAKMLKARKFKKDQIYPPSLISPAQVMKSEFLTDKQKADIEAKYISIKAGALKLKKVSRATPVEKTAEALFGDVVAPSVFEDVAPASDPISFI